MKRFWSVSIATIMAISLTACGTASAGSKAPAESKQADFQTGAGKKQETSANKEADISIGAMDVSLEELEEMVASDTEDTIGALTEEYGELLLAIDAYEKYAGNVETIEGFYNTLYSETKSLCIRLREYSVDYAKVILASDRLKEDKYADLEAIYDDIYEDAADEIYDEIYDGILDDAYDDLYDGILKDGYENADYTEWSDLRSEEYEWWSDSRSEVYEEWSDLRSEVYDFWSDMRGEVWDDDIEKAQEVINDFAEDIEKLKAKDLDNVKPAVSETESTVAKNSEETVDNNSEEKESAENNSDLVDGMRPEFKEAMDSYAAFYEEYCAVLKKV